MSDPGYIQSVAQQGSTPSQTRIYGFYKGERDKMKVAVSEGRPGDEIGGLRGGNVGTTCCIVIKAIVKLLALVKSGRLLGAYDAIKKN